MGDDLAAAQLLEKVLSTFERFHFDIDAADLRERVGIGACAAGNTEGATQFLGSTIDVRLRPSVEDLDDIDLPGNPLDRRFPQIAPTGVVGVLEVDETALAFDGRDRSFR